MWVLIALAPLLASPAHAAPPADEPVIAAASNEHLWFVRSSGREAPAWELCHHATAMRGPHYRPQLPLERMPAAMAAWDDQLWLVFEPDGSAQRDVFTVRIQRLSLTEPYFQTIPPDRMELVAALPADGALAGFAATPDGPVALLAAAGDARAGEPQLLQLHGSRWVELALPTPSPIAGNSLLLGLQGHGAQLAVVSREPAATGAGLRSVRIDRRDAEGRWESDLVPEWPGDAIHAAGFGDQVALFTADATADRWTVLLARDGQALRAADLPAPASRSTVLTLGDTTRLLFTDAARRLIIQELYLPAAGVGEMVALTPQPAGSRSLWAMAIAFAAIVGGVLLVLVVRPGSRKPVTLPAGWRQVPIFSRLLALLLDLLPAAIVTMLALEARPADLARIPLLTPDFADSWPYLLMVFLTVAHSLIGELAFRRSLGMAFLDAQVVGEGAGSPSAVQILLRNLVKLLMLVIPPLAVFALITPNLQGLHDALSRTIVAHQSEGDEQVRKERGN